MVRKPRLLNLRLMTRRSFALGVAAVTVGIFPGRAVGRFAWPNGARAAVSLTYDDGCDSQLENVAPLLDELGLKATFFLTIENVDARRADWIAVAKSGHEIGDHTMTHPCRLSGYSVEQFAHEQIAPAERYLDANFGGPKPRSYAYTCGFEGLGRGETVARVRRYVEVLSSTFVAARTVNGPPNDPQEVMAQRYFLNGFEPTYDSDDPHLALAYVEKAIHRGHWAILVFHEVLDTRKASGDTSKAVHRTILEHISRQPVWCAPMRNVFGHVTGLA